MRRETTTVKIGNIILSSEEPVVIQSMLNTPTLDTEACIEQAIRIIKAGGQLVRVTAQGVKEAENLQYIRAGIRERGYGTPLSADIHFNPDAALVAAHYVEKVRINPGNFVDKRATFKNLTYTDEEYAEELIRLRERFCKFLDVCREYGTAVRIGTNHGSLSDRIMSRYGNTPAGMVEATMEYLRVCLESGFNQVVISLKSSDCRVMVEAVRLLVKTMEREGMYYPLHLGVTEAGEGEDGRIRSAIGIGTLLNEGLGDTIRVSLTEAPEAEIPVAKALAGFCKPDYVGNTISLVGNYTKPVIVADISHRDVVDEDAMNSLGFYIDKPNDPIYGAMLRAGIKAPEMIYTEALGPELTKLPPGTIVIVPHDNIAMAHIYNRNACPLLTKDEFVKEYQNLDSKWQFVEIKRVEEIDPAFAEKLKSAKNALIVLSVVCHYHLYKELLQTLAGHGIKNKVIIKTHAKDTETINIEIASQVGGLFLDRLVYGLWISGSTGLDLSRNILQSAGLRRYKTEFVSCPGCGRTLFDLQHAVASVKQAFSHLNTLKIAVMGCIVNGPGEMGDADYGYVGAGNGKVNLYKGKQVVKVGIPEQDAIAALKQLIVDNGDWEEA